MAQITGNLPESITCTPKICRVVLIKSSNIYKKAFIHRMNGKNTFREIG